MNSTIAASSKRAGLLCPSANLEGVSVAIQVLERLGISVTSLREASLQQASPGAGPAKDWQLTPAGQRIRPNRAVIVQIRTGRPTALMNPRKVSGRHGHVETFETVAAIEVAAESASFRRSM